MAFEIVAREEDLATVNAFVGQREGGAAALVLEGEAGIGKSTLWLAAVEMARGHGLRVLSARPAEAERGLAHVGLGDLFDEVLDDFLPELSLPRRRALEVALLRDEASDESVDDRALAVAVRDLLQLLSERKPTLIAIDDVQWLDPSSAGALAFALRRLGASHVLLLLARRVVDGAEPSALEQAVRDERVQRLSVGPLSVGALHRLLRDRFGKSFARQTLLRVHERSGGNPFFALELARALEVDADPTQPFPVPQTLDELVRARIVGLPERTREALGFAAALGTPSTSVLERTGVDAQALNPAFAAHVIELDAGAIRFTHPLLSSVVYADLGDERREVHRRLAAVVEDPLVRARHLALATESPNAEVAAVLDDAVRVAADRGATALAAELAEHAVRLCDDEAHHCHALAAARAHQAAGEWTRARTIATDLLAEAEPGPQRAEALVLLAEFEVDELAAPLLEEALTEAAADTELRLHIGILLALTRRFTSGWAAALDDVRAVFQALEDLADDALLVEALNVAAFLGRGVGDPNAPAFAARAREIAGARGNHELGKEWTALLGKVLVDRGEHAQAREALERDYRQWRERDERVAADVLRELGLAELWSGNFARAADDVARAHEISVQYGTESHTEPIPGMWVAALRGQFDVARSLARHGLELCAEQLGVAGPYFPGVLGLVAFWSGDVASGAEQFAEADRLAASVDWREPTMRRWTADYVEALLELGRIDDAARVLDGWEADAVRLGRAWVLAQVARCRGLVAAARGDVEQAAVLLEDAVVRHQRVSDPFGRARALLALGVVRRRERQKRAARDAIGAALAEFEQLGAASWIEKARAELGRIGGRTRESGLTAAERRVAALVAEGRTNREVAAALFVGQRTVETHLSHVYTKLGVRSRAELARTFRAGEQSSGGLTISS
jgi:DNA-binding CsgD family transcriptional regulator